MTPEEVVSAQKASHLSKAIADLGIQGPAVGQLTTLLKDRISLTSDASGFALKTPDGSPVATYLATTLSSEEFSSFKPLIPDPKATAEFIGAQASQISASAGRPAGSTEAIGL